MKSVMQPFSLKKPTLEDLSLTGAWVLWAVIIGLLPLWGGWLVMIIKKQGPQLDDFVSSGEFALYTAATIAPAVFTVLISYKQRGIFPFGFTILLLSLIVLIYSVLVFGGVFPSGASEDTVGAAAMAWLTIPSYLLAIVLGTVVFHIEKEVVAYSPNELESMQLDQMRKRMSLPAGGEQ